MTRIGAERGWPPQTRAQFETACGPNGHLLIGAPNDVAGKIVALHKIFRFDRILVQMAIGTMPHDKVRQAIELMGTRVAPMVRQQLGQT
jgi:alkanesulfonate monooxygenase SsuD/methylene tetrahydromethanopterin reductase-like flavin-dependent oxidoreductase (luciferase family)